MITRFESFGRSENEHRVIKSHVLVVLISLLFISFCEKAYCIGSTGLFATKLKVEYQYSDYDSYVYPVIEPGDSIKYGYIDPYILNFPENRALTKITQSLGHLTTLEIRHEYSGLTENADQNRSYLRLARDISDLFTVYGGYQFSNIGFDQPDSSDSGGHMVSMGAKYDRSGWIKGEASLSFDYNESSQGMVSRSYMPMLQIRWSINSLTALTGRWDGFWTINEVDTYPGHALTVFLSRYLPTQTALHLFTRFYYNDYSVKSLSPSLEIAQYIQWNLTARVTYRYYQSEFDSANLPDFIDGSTLKSHALRAIVEWHCIPGLQLNLKLRRYSSDQDIIMNTYLLGMEWEI